MTFCFGKEPIVWTLVPQNLFPDFYPDRKGKERLGKGSIVPERKLYIT